jgi:hypothetical protein
MKRVDERTTVVHTVGGHPSAALESGAYVYISLIYDYIHDLNGIEVFYVCIYVCVYVYSICRHMYIRMYIYLLQPWFLNLVHTCICSYVLIYI